MLADWARGVTRREDGCIVDRTTADAASSAVRDPSTVVRSADRVHRPPAPATDRAALVHPAVMGRGIVTSLVLALVLSLTLSGASSAVAGAPASARGDGARWSWPVTAHSVLRHFIAPEQRWSAGHRGVDLAAMPGAEVLAPDDGVVHFAGFVVDRAVLSILHAGGLISSFEPVRSDLTAGQRVRRGDPVGVVEPGGHCDAGCLHFGARLDGEYVSPLMLLGGLPRSVLLPTREAP